MLIQLHIAVKQCRLYTEFFKVEGAFVVYAKGVMGNALVVDLIKDMEKTLSDIFDNEN